MLQNATRFVIYNESNQILQNKLQFNINILIAKNLFFNIDIFHVQENSINRRCKNLRTY